MRVTDNIVFPDIQEILVKAKTIDDVWDSLIAWFSDDQENLDMAACASKLIELNNMRDARVISQIDEDFKEIKDLLREIARRYGHIITITRRQKSVISVIVKMIYLIKEGQKEGKTVFASLERLKDFLGFRMVAQTGEKDTPESQEMCYHIMNEVLKYLVVKKKNTLETLEYDKTIRRNFEGILIPEKSGILDPFRDNVKDYVYYIKEKKYQRLHAVPMNPNHQKFELQVGTQEIEIRAEYDDETSHRNHKFIKYEDIEIPVDLRVVKIEGFTCLPDGTIHDSIGLLHAIDPLNLLR